MSLHLAFLIVHVAAGSLGLLVGPVAMLVPKRPGWHPRLGKLYQALVGLLALSSIGLAALHPAVWWLGVVGLATWGAALGGWYVRRRARPGWIPVHIGLMCGSYISFVTAFLVVNLGLGSIVAWVLPTLVGSPLIARATARRVRPGARRATA
jgi:hypothetical protein